MENLIKSDVPLEIKNFWSGIESRLCKKTRASIELLYDKIENSVIIKLSFNEICFNITLSFRVHEYFKSEDVYKMIMDAIQYEVYEKMFR